MNQVYIFFLTKTQQDSKITTTAVRFRQMLISYKGLVDKKKGLKGKK